jgi:hypothetical protein
LFWGQRNTVTAFSHIVARGENAAEFRYKPNFMRASLCMGLARQYNFNRKSLVTVTADGVA